MTTDNLTEGYVNHHQDDHGIATIAFFHPAHNSLPGHLLSKLANTITAAGANPDAKVIVLKSDGDRTFCAGASFDELIAIKTAAQGYQFFSGFANVINACRICPKVILGRVQGKAIGGGIGVAASSDYCFATKHAAIKLSELAIGIGPFVVGPAIERKIGLPAFTRLALSPTIFEPAEWAKEQGLYHEVFQDAEAMDDAIQEMAMMLCTYNPQALTALKQSLWRGTEDWEELLAERARTSGKLVLSDFARDAIAAFKAKK